MRDVVGLPWSAGRRREALAALPPGAFWVPYLHLNRGSPRALPDEDRLEIEAAGATLVDVLSSPAGVALRFHKH